MRGQIDLSGHRMVGKYIPPKAKLKATYVRHKKKAPIKEVDFEYRQLWIIIDGAIRDTFNCHPEYLTDAGKRHAQLSLGKRITGAIHGHATLKAAAQALAGGRSGNRDDRGMAADAEAPSTKEASEDTGSAIGHASNRITPAQRLSVWVRRVLRALRTL